MSYHSPQAKVTLDALATTFFAAATVWLVLAVLYSLSVLVFIRMRSRGQLGSVYDADFGRVYLFGNNNNNNGEERRSCFLYRLYLPMGCLFRRFVMLSRTDEERQRQVNQIIRVMTPEERREAMEVLLFSSSATTDKEEDLSKQEKGSYQKQQRLPSPDSADRVNTTVDLEQDSSTLDGSDDSSSSRAQPLEAANGGNDDEERGTNPVRAKSSLSCEYGDNDCDCNDIDEEGPSCSICLAEFDHDVAAAALEAGLALENHGVLVSKTCTHQFHSDCILSWLERGNNTECPCCRVPMVTEDDVWATVKEHRKEEQRRKSKQQKRTLINFLFGRGKSDDSQQQQKADERGNDDDSGEDTMDVTEQSETSVGDDDEQAVSSSHMAVPSLPPLQQPEQTRRNSSSIGAGQWGPPSM